MRVVLKFGIILLCALQEPQVGRPVFGLARTLVGVDLSLLPPPLHISTAEHFEGFVLADELRVVGILFEQVYDSCCHIADECFVTDAFVGEVNHGYSSFARFVRSCSCPLPCQCS